MHHNEHQEYCNITIIHLKTTNGKTCASHGNLGAPRSQGSAVGQLHISDCSHPTPTPKQSCTTVGELQIPDF